MINLQGFGILAVDDEKKLVEILRAYLEKAGAKFFAAHSGKEALGIFAAQSIDLVLLDLMLPDISGEEVCKIMRKESDVPIIMLTAKAEENDELEGLTAGADDYITKPFSNKILLARIETLLRRVKPVPSDFSDGILWVRVEDRLLKKSEKTVNLSKIEWELLTAFLKNPEKTLSRDQLIWYINEDFDGFDRTIDAHIKNLRKKLEDNPKTPRYIQTVYGLGYKWAGGAIGR